jgi:hypothetical protein
MSILMNPAYHNDDGSEWLNQIAEMASTIDALNTNIVLLNRFISSAINLSSQSVNLYENVEIMTFDSSGNISACVKSDGSGNFIPCNNRDLSGNLIPCVLPPMKTGPHVYVNKPTTDKKRCFNPYYYPYSYLYGYPYLSGLLDYDYYDRGLPVIKPPPHGPGPVPGPVHVPGPFPKDTNLHLHIHP